MAAAFDYSGLASTATDLIAQFGRDVVLAKASITPADPAKPWGADEDEAVATDDVSVTAKAVQVSPVEQDEAGRVVKRTQATYLIAGASLGTERLDDTWTVTDQGRTYAILDAVPLQPGGTLLVYKVAVRT